MDTLHILKAFDSEVTGGCVKLQCQLTRLKAVDGSLQAHRALDRCVIIFCGSRSSRSVCMLRIHPQDDCFALRGVLGSLAGHLGVSVAALVSPFCVSMDKGATLLHLSCLL